MPLQNVDAITAVSTSDGAVITSLTSGFWEKVWVNQNGTIAYLLDSSGTDVKIAKVNLTSGALISNVTVTAGGNGANPSAISEVFTINGINMVVYAQQAAVATSLDLDRINIDNGSIVNSVNGQATTCTTAANVMTVYVTKNKVYFVGHNNNNASLCTQKSNLDLSGFAAVANAAQNGLTTTGRTVCEVVTDGVTESGDMAYCMLSGGGGTPDAKVAKFANGVYTSKGTISGGSGQLTDAFWAGNTWYGRADNAGTETTVSITISTDTYNGAIASTNWINWNVQTTHLDVNGTRTFSPANRFVATSTLAEGYDGTGRAAMRMPALTVDNATGTITWFTTTFYRLSDSIFATVSGTTTTIKVVGAGVKMAPVAYSEKLQTPLVLNSTLFGLDLIQAVCDANYEMKSGKLFVGSDSDCTSWRIKDVSAATQGRVIPYSRTAPVIHTDEYTNYNIHLTSTEGTVDNFFARIKYESKLADQSNFDGGSNAALRMLYGQCYTMEFVDTLDSSVVQSSNVCADDVIFKESILSSTLGFVFWNSPWGAIPSWNDTSNVLQVTVRHEPFPYNYTVQIFNKTNHLILTDAQNSTQEVDSETYNLTAFANDCGIGNTTCHNPFTVKVLDENNSERHSSYFDQGGDYLFGLRQEFDTVNFNGWGILLFIPIIFASMFTRNSAGIGGALTVTVIGALVFFGVLDPTVFNPVIIGVMFFVAIIGLLAYKVMN